MLIWILSSLLICPMISFLETAVLFLNYVHGIYTELVFGLPLWLNWATNTFNSELVKKQYQKGQLNSDESLFSSLFRIIPVT